MMMFRSLVVPSVLSALCALSLVACSKNNEPPPPTSGSPTAKPETGPMVGPTTHPRRVPAAASQVAQRRYTGLCANCHGLDGKANTPSAAQLDPKPRDYTNAAWQASVTDDQLREIILKGGQALGKSPAMPGNPDLADRPEVVDELVQIVRGFGKPSQ
jgi:cytochrome c553